MPIIPLSERRGMSLRQTLIKFINAIDYSFTTYPQFSELELAMRNDILSFGIDLRPEWETILRTTSTLIGAAYIKHPIEVQISVGVYNVSPFFYAVLLIHSGAY